MNKFRTFTPTPSSKPQSDWKTIGIFLPYVWVYKWRVSFALLFLILAKVAGMGVPIVLKELIDGLSVVLASPQALLLFPAGLLVAYGALRLIGTLFMEFRELLFVRVTQRAIRTVALEVFRHLHALSLRFHLDRQTGSITQDIERGTRSILALITFTLFNIFPTLVEIVLVLGYLALHYDIWFSIIAATALAAYVVYTVVVTNWRTHFRRQMNELNSRAHSRAVDSLINYETVKYFGNEAHEAASYDVNLQHYEVAAIRSQYALSVLNIGQAFIVAAAVTMMLWHATAGVVEKTMSLGDMVLVNAFMIQLYIPLNFLGVIYREIRQSLADMERMFLLLDQEREVTDAPDATELKIKRAQIRFSHVDFSYESERQILQDISFTIEAGTVTALVGHSGSGKSTISRLLYRFYDVTGGAVMLDGEDVRHVTQASLRKEIGIVPQDTVLFNDTIEYNIAYGCPGATQEEIVVAAKAAFIHDFIESLPNGYGTVVGERGLKLSGGEKQRVAIARMILKNPAILIFDEATSALDTHAEQVIQSQLKEIAKNRTTLMIAHRLSTIVDADQILVLEKGKIIESGTHQELFEAGTAYYRMWMQQLISLNAPEEVVE